MVLIPPPAKLCPVLAFVQSVVILRVVPVVMGIVTWGCKNLLLFEIMLWCY